MHIILRVLADYELFINVETWDEGHGKEKYLYCLSWVLLNDFCTWENDHITSKKLSKSKENKTSNILPNFQSITFFFNKDYFVLKIYLLLEYNLLVCLYLIPFFVFIFSIHHLLLICLYVYSFNYCFFVPSSIIQLLLYLNKHFLIIT